MSETISADEFAQRYDVKPELSRLAQHFITSRDVIVLGVSGKLGAGKDTVAPLVLDGLGYSDPVHEFFAKPLKDEVTDAIGRILNANTIDNAARSIASGQNVDIPKAQVIATRLWEDVKSGEVVTSYKRTPATRFALQYWGTDIRREQDLNYWVKRAISMTVNQVSAGVSVFVTDARFENEIDALTAFGAHTVRLVVSPEEQTRRIIERDGVAPSKEATDHISETALDSYEKLGKFDVIVDTDEKDLQEVVADIVDAINAKRG